MKIIDCIQGSAEWLALRRSKITATDCAAILGKSKYKSPHMVWLDKMGKSKAFDNEAMKRGRELEPEARAYYNQKLGRNYQPAVVLSDENPWQMASLDGWDEEHKEVLEIKCPGESVFREAQAGNFSQDYVWQCLHQLSIDPTIRQVNLGFYYKAQDRVETTEACFGRDDNELKDLVAKEWAFYKDYVLRFVEPPLGSLDYQQRDDEEWERLCQQWKIIKQDLKDLEDDEKMIREQLISLAGDQSCRGAGIQLTKYTRQGNVEYAKIPELKGVDLSPYRKPTIDAWRLTELDKDPNHTV